MRYYINKLLLPEQLSETITYKEKRPSFDSQLWSIRTISSWPCCFGAYEMEDALAAHGETTFSQDWERAKVPSSILNPLFPR